MTVTFNTIYSSSWDNKTNPQMINEGAIYHPKFVKWTFEYKEYMFTTSFEDFLSYVYVSQEIIVVLFHNSSKTHPHPNNLVMYNLRQEVIGIIPHPKLVTTKFDEPVTAIGDMLYIDGRQYLPVVVNYGDVELTVERHYYDIKNRTYHPDKIDIKKLPNYR